jgi:hypothetical protein
MELVMTKKYNDYSQSQRLGLLKGLTDIFQPILRQQVPCRLRNEWKRKLILADFGCSGGKNSMIMIQNIFDMLKNELNPELFILQACLTDLPQNDYNAVFQAYQESSVLPEKDISLSCSVGSFYNQIFPANSVNLACSFTALHWLSQTEQLGRFDNPECCVISCADAEKDKVKIQELLDLSKRDLQSFLLARKKELTKDGLITFSCLGVEELIPTQEMLSNKDEIALRQLQQKSVHSVPWNLDDLPRLLHCYHCFDEMGILLEKTRQHFGISLAPNQTQFLTLIPKTADDVRTAIASHPELNLSFEILFCQVQTAPDPYWSKYVSGEYDLSRFVEEFMGFSRAWSESSVNHLLLGRQDCVEFFFEQFRETLQTNPNKFYMEPSFLYCCLRKL